MHVKLIPLVGFTVHVDRQVGDDQQVPVHLHQPGRYAARPAHHHPPRYGQGAVKPWGAKHPAILFYVKFYIFLFHQDFRVGFDFQSRGIAVAGHNLKTRKISFGDLKSNKGRIIAGNIIPLPCLQFPWPPFRQPYKPLLFQHRPHVGDGMETGRAVVQEFQQLLIDRFKHYPNPSKMAFNFSTSPSAKQ